MERVRSPGVTLDGFREQQAEAFGGYRPVAAARFLRLVERLGDRLHVEVEGIERIPAGRALIVANHAFGWDAVFPMAAIHESTGRDVFVLGEHLWWKVPFLRRIASTVGTVDGSSENVDRLLADEALVVVLPGGLREAVKPAALRYRLLWGERYGFVRAAIRNRCPIVPLASIGADELFNFVGDAVERGERLLGRFGLGFIPLPRPAHLLPWPHRVHLRYVLGDPIAPPFPPSAADDHEAQREFRWMVEGALHELLDRELAFRAHVSLAPHRRH